MTASLLVGCGGDTDQSAVTTADSTAYSSVDEEDNTDDVQTEESDFFGASYDPFADDYDPYSQGGAAAQTTVEVIAVTNSTETLVSAKETEASDVTASSAKTESNNDVTADTTPDITEGISITFKAENSWNDGSSSYAQFNGIVSCSGTSVGSWTAEITVGSGISVDQHWNCSLSLENGIITVVPEEYNSVIADGESVSFGIILKNADINDSFEATVSGQSISASASSGNTYYSGVSYTPAKDVPEATTDDWLHTDGSKIYDDDGNEVWLTGINWFGYNTGTNTFDGLWSCGLNTSISSIADRGFNLLRVPISAELILEWSEGSYPTANFNQATNYYLVGLNSLKIFDYVIGQCRANGIKIMIDIHSAETDASGHNYNMWYNGDITEEDYLAALSWIAARYSQDDTIIAYDLKNEPHGKANESPRAKWDDSTDSDNWKYIAEKAAAAVLGENPNVLIVVEGIEIYPTDTDVNGDFSSQNPFDYYYTWWGGNLRGVADNPVDLGKYQNKLVYSPHDYGPTVYAQSWFDGDYTYESLYEDVWHDNWFYIQENDIAPLLIGEWGGL
ncbi:MAG: cellulase family glycosylhydrolase [Oscillospiraceae bacterium]|nr:cellulase family glycosylhydrolase [Oscillospiraceae bacterium]